MLPPPRRVAGSPCQPPPLPDESCGVAALDSATAGSGSARHQQPARRRPMPLALIGWWTDGLAPSPKQCPYLPLPLLYVSGVLPACGASPRCQGELHHCRKLWDSGSSRATATCPLPSALRVRPSINPRYFSNPYVEVNRRLVGYQLFIQFYWKLKV